MRHACLTAKQFLFALFQQHVSAFNMIENSSLSSNWVIRNTPPDVWRSIFDSFSHIPSTSVVQIMRLAHVCSTWRTTVNGASELWTNVHVDLSAGKDAFPSSDFLTHILRNSRTRPLDMVLSRTRQLLSVDDLLSVKLFLQAMSRARTLNIDLSIPEVLFESQPHLFGQLTTQLQSARWLEKLEIGEDYGEDETLTTLLSRLWNPAAPSLRALSYGYDIDTEELARFSASGFPFTQLTALEFRNTVDIETFLSVLSKTPSLATAKFDQIDGDIDNVSDDVPGHVSLLHLQTLKLGGQGCHTDESPPLTRLLEFLTCPKLTTLGLSFDREWSPDSFRTFLRKSSPLIEHLELDIVDSSQSEKIECLKLLPSLRTLDLASYRDGEERDAFQDHFLGKEICAAMREWDASAESFVICPNLEKLTIDYGALIDTTETMFADMIEDRWRRSHEKNGFALEITEAYDLGEEQEMLSELIRLFVLKKAGLNFKIEPATWLENLFSH